MSSTIKSYSVPFLRYVEDAELLKVLLMAPDPLQQLSSQSFLQNTKRTVLKRPMPSGIVVTHLYHGSSQGKAEADQSTQSHGSSGKWSRAPTKGWKTDLSAQQSSAAEFRSELPQRTALSTAVWKASGQLLDADSL